MTQHTVSLFGAGKIGEAITAILARSGRYSVQICDQEITKAQQVGAEKSGAIAGKLDLSNEKSTLDTLHKSAAVISALPFSCNVRVAELARKAGVHYFDLTEDVTTSRAIEEIANGSSRCFMPQCGIAPGFISIAAASLIKSFDSVHSVKMRVGALPRFPTNSLKYNLTWSTEGLINEYGNPCEAIIKGKKQSVLPLDGYERFFLDGDEYEAFNTSGGLGTFCESMAGRISFLDYKTIRYPGHRDFVAFLMNELKFNEDRETLKRVFERSLPATSQDKCVIFIEAIGNRNSILSQETYARVVYDSSIDGVPLTAIKITTASGVCVPVDLVLENKIGKGGGFVKNEMIELDDFLAHEFGVFYRNA